MDYSRIANEARKEILQILHESNGSFSGTALSCIDIMTVLYYGIMRLTPETADDTDRDMFLLSKGHGSSALYVTLANMGFFSKEDVSTYCKDGSKLASHPKRGSYPGIEVSTGSLGHGLALGIGSALAAKIRKSDANVFVLMGDGECNEGSVWEAAMFAPRQKLNNLIAIVDNNNLQGYGTDKDVLDMGDMGEKFRAFHFNVIDIDGHNFDEIEAALKEAVSKKNDRPTAIIAHTVKGKGVSFMENKLEWHYKSPSVEQLKTALEELGK